jgi:hypothetical protein
MTSLGDSDSYVKVKVGQREAEHKPEVQDKSSLFRSGMALSNFKKMSPKTPTTPKALFCRDPRLESSLIRGEYFPG